MLELSWTGTKKVLVGSEQRTFLEDGDCVKMVGWAQAEGYRVGFGECVGEIMPATP
jgi:fumarylacetoacetase